MRRWTSRCHHKDRCPRWARKCAKRWQDLAATWWRRSVYARDLGLLDLAREYQWQAQYAYLGARMAVEHMEHLRP